MMMIITTVMMMMIGMSTTTIAGGESSSSSFYQRLPHWKYYPRVYVAPYCCRENNDIDNDKTTYKLLDHLDGDLSKPVWQQVKWSEGFDDIRGVQDVPNASDRPAYWGCTTKFKALWDDTHLYIGALLENDSGFISPQHKLETHAEYTKRNSPIYQRDSDFEVFLDPLGTNHNYKEFEINAINTVWNLLLDKPYGDGGVEHSGREWQPGDRQYYEVYQQKTATKLLGGELNRPKQGGATWSVEMAFSYQDLFANITATTNDNNNKKTRTPPKVGDMWRINFSHVEKQGEINWTWQPQIVWCAEEKRYKGYVAMHLPDAWGYIVFGDGENGNNGRSDSRNDPNKNNKNTKRPSAINGTPPRRDPSWPVRLAAMNIYYAQHAYKKRRQEQNNKDGTYASNVQELMEYVDLQIVDPFQVQIVLNEEKTEFVATLKYKETRSDGDGCDGGVERKEEEEEEWKTMIASITQDRYLQVKQQKQQLQPQATTTQ